MAQFPQSRLSVSDDIRSGNAVAAGRTKLGIPLEGAEAQAVRTISLGAPAVAAANNISLAQAIAGAADATITGALATSGVATTDVPRGVQVLSTNAGDTTQVVTVTGTDAYGATVVEAITLNGTTPVLGKKAFKTITRVQVSAVMVGNLTVGTSSILGLPYRPVLGGFVRGIANENTADAGTYVAPIRTTSTSTTADVRGTYTPAGTLNATNVFTVTIAIQNGPEDFHAYGIAQFAG